MSEAKVVIIYAGAASCAFASAAAGMSAVFTHPEITPQRPHWLAGAPGFEPGNGGIKI